MKVSLFAACSNMEPQVSTHKLIAVIEINRTHIMRCSRTTPKVIISTINGPRGEPGLRGFQNDSLTSIT